LSTQWKAQKFFFFFTSKKKIIQKILVVLKIVDSLLCTLVFYLSAEMYRTYILTGSTNGYIIFWH